MPALGGMGWLLSSVVSCIFSASYTTYLVRIWPVRFSFDSSPFSGEYKVGPWLWWGTSPRRIRPRNTRAHRPQQRPHFSRRGRGRDLYRRHLPNGRVLQEPYPLHPGTPYDLYLIGWPITLELDHAAGGLEWLTRRKLSSHSEPASREHPIHSLYGTWSVRLQRVNAQSGTGSGRRGRPAPSSIGRADGRTLRPFRPDTVRSKPEISP